MITIVLSLIVPKTENEITRAQRVRRVFASLGPDTVLDAVRRKTGPGKPTEVVRHLRCQDPPAHDCKHWSTAARRRTQAPDHASCALVSMLCQQCDYMWLIARRAVCVAHTGPL